MRSTMKVYELSIKYSLVEEGPVEALSNASKVVEYISAKEPPVAGVPFTP